MRITYRLAEETRERAFIESGTVLAPQQTVEIEDSSISTEHRAHFVAATHKVEMPFEFKILGYMPTVDGVYAQSFSSNTPAYVELPDQIDPLQLLADDMERYQEALEVSARQREQAAQDRLRANAEADARRADEVEAEAKAKAEREQRKAERGAWIIAHGSSRLRKCLDGGYDCQREYAIERAALEFPGYVLDFEDESAWKDRSGPSEAALDEAARVNGGVVWLTAAAQAVRPDYEDRYDEDSFEPCEAIVILNYLGKYDLVKEIL